jgi:hypothetical protein
MSCSHNHNHQNSRHIVKVIPKGLIPLRRIRERKITQQNLKNRVITHTNDGDILYIVQEKNMHV